MNMRNRCGALILMFFLLAFPAQCRPHHQQLDAGAARRRVTNATLDESKVVVVFCSEFQCYTEEAFPTKERNCYCCLNQKPEVCYDTWNDCQAACPSCNPKCPPT
ncbi:unnamed protein product [Urochloa decumbens]|uniref:Meg domain-containing protein n=1 Tax=Urochloa decumbens TaxID=240449 RepID=A0ABC8WYW6_9POAL